MGRLRLYIYCLTMERTRRPRGSTEGPHCTRRHPRAKRRLRLLLDHGANVHAEDEDKWTPLHLASFKGNTETVRLLLDRGANADSKNKDGRSPLHEASSKGRKNTVRLLLDHGANAIAEDNGGWTPLHVASSEGETETVRLLLGRGASADAKDNEGRTSSQTVLTTLRRLLLSVLSDSSIGASWSNVCWVHFWGTLCPHMILAPTQQALTELTLHSDAPVGASSGLSLAGLYFPLLCVFSVRGLVFELSVEVETFVLRHAATLAQLEVLACKLPTPANLPLSYSQSISTALARDEGLSSGPGGWDWIWDCFAAELTALVTLDVDTQCRYIEPSSFWEVPFPESRCAADAAALQRFHMTVAARSRETRGES
ncbi:ankyrin repeat-containing domain protein [Lactarius hengduanensis]|nr:ankyrin repeat-containing domain protein [Lactarius hengduanensis]